MQRKHIVLSLLLICIAIICIGCGSSKSSKSNSYDVISEPGFYKDVLMMPNGKFIARHKLTEEEANNIGRVYKVDFNDDKKLEKITAQYSGTPINTEWIDTINNSFTFSIMTVEYQDGYVKYNFKNSRMAPTTGFYDAYSIRYKLSDDKKQHKIAYLYNKQGEQAANALGFAQMLFTYDDKDALIKVGYANLNGERVTTKSKEYETHFKYDKSTHPSEVANYGKDGSLMVDATSIAKYTYKFDEQGRITEVRHFGSDESLKERNISNTQLLNFDILNLSAGAITKYTYNEKGDYPTKISFYGKDEQPMGIKDWGDIASLSLNYTDKEELSEIATFGTDDTPKPLDKKNLGDNVVKARFAYDSNGNLSTTTFYGKDDNMVVAEKLNAAEIHRKYDEKRRLSEIAYFGTASDAINIQLAGQTFHREVREYNDDDEITQYIYFDKDGKEVAKKQTPIKADDNNASANNSNNNSSNTVPRQTGALNSNDLSLGNVTIGDTIDKVRATMGGPGRVTTEDGQTHWKYNDVDLTIVDGKVATIISSTSAASTPRGFHEGSLISSVWQTYGNNYRYETYANLKLYEYPITSKDGAPCLLRFAVKNGENTVYYVSMRKI